MQQFEFQALGFLVLTPVFLNGSQRSLLVQCIAQLKKTERPSIKWHGNSIISGALGDTFSNSPTPDSVGALTNSVCQGLGLCYLVKICSWGYYLVSLPVLTGKDTKELKMFKESFQSRVITPPI